MCMSLESLLIDTSRLARAARIYFSIILLKLKLLHCIFIYNRIWVILYMEHLSQHCYCVLYLYSKDWAILHLGRR
jgi:hypothetical protein